MANYTGAARRLYNFQRRIRYRIKQFEKAGVELPAELEPTTGRIGRILAAKPSKVNAGLLRDIATVESQLSSRKKHFTVSGALEERRRLLERISKPVSEGGLGFTNVTKENKSVFFDFMEYVREKFENMRFDSDIYAAAANEMLGQAKRRGVTAEQLKDNFERFADQAIRTTGNFRTLENYPRNFNRLARRLGL